MAAYIYTVLKTYPTPTPTAITRLNQGPCLNLSLRNLYHLLAASVLQVPKPMDVPFNPSTSCQGAHHVFVVFLLHHDVTVGLGKDGVGSGVSMGPLSTDTQPPPSSADSAWFLTQNRVSGTRTDGRRNRAPQAPFLRTGNRNGTRISISGVICGFKKHSY